MTEWIHGAHFIEATDSIHSRDWRPETLSHKHDLRVAQVAMECLLTLAFGRDIVISQTYALDSITYQRVLEVVATAYKRVTPKLTSQTRPMRLHLFRANSYSEALVQTADTIRAGEFDSSLFRSTDDQNALREAIVRLQAERSASLRVDDLRGHLFDVTWNWFKTAERGRSRLVVTPDPDPNSPSLEVAIGRLIDDERTRHYRSGLPHLIGERVEDVRSILKRLSRATISRATSPTRPFADRSPFWSDDRVWQLDGHQFTIDELCGDGLAYVREVVDTLYNRVVVGSIGTASASYTTDIAEIGHAAVAMAIQAFSLDESAEDENLPAYDDLEDPPFEFLAGTDDGEGPDSPARAFGAEVLQRAEQWFEDVLIFREEPECQDSVITMGRLRRQLFDRYTRDNRKRYDEAVQKHIALVDKRLYGTLMASSDGKRLGVGVGLPILATGAGVGATAAVYKIIGSSTGILEQFAGSIAGGIVVSGFVLAGTHAWSEHRDRRHVRRCLGALIGPAI